MIDKTLVFQHRLAINLRMRTGRNYACAHGAEELTTHAHEERRDRCRICALTKWAYYCSLEKLQSALLYIAVSRGAVNNTIYTAVEDYKLEPWSYGTGTQCVSVEIRPHRREPWRCSWPSLITRKRGRTCSVSRRVKSFASHPKQTRNGGPHIPWRPGAMDMYQAATWRLVRSINEWIGRFSVASEENKTVMAFQVCMGC